MKTNLRTVIGGLVLVALGMQTAVAAPARTVAADPEALGQLLASLIPGDASTAEPVESVRYGLSEDGTLKFLAAPPGQRFATVASTPATAAIEFVEAHARAFGIARGSDRFVVRSARSLPTRTFVKLDQLHADVQVFAGEAIVQLDAEGRVQCVVAALARDLDGVDPRPSLAATEILAIARREAAPTTVEDDIEISTPRPMIYAPKLLEMPGEPRLVWECRVASEARPEIAARLLIDARTGEVVARISLHYEALNRQISDANSGTGIGTLVRVEGQGACGIPDGDNVYDYLGDTYTYYLAQHGRDSYNGSGSALPATVRRCTATQCPWPNASWNGTRMLYGTGFAVDDVTGHEMTHAVTELESNLLYQNASGAINESLSDVWGEFIDLGNGRGTDTPAVRWDIAEDLTGGRLRSMSNPAAMGLDDPDRLGSANYVPAVGTPTQANDFGGVHTNSGVNNKLCFLLVDGQTFNGYAIAGMGIPRIADLYYEVATNLLTSTSGWTELFNGLQQAALNIGWNLNDRTNLFHACQAVEIAVPIVQYVTPSIICTAQTGHQFCGQNTGPYRTLGLAENLGALGALLNVEAGFYPENIIFDKPLDLRAIGGIVRIGQ